MDQGDERRRDPGGIRELVGLIDEHRAAFEYDWRTRFHVALSAVGRSMTWGEAWRLTVELLPDPSSHVGAAVLGLEYPVSREWMVLVAIRDAHARVHFKDPAAYPTPWKAQPTGSVLGSAEEQVLTQEQIDALLSKNSGRTLSPPRT